MKINENRPSGHPVLLGILQQIENINFHVLCDPDIEAVLANWLAGVVTDKELKSKMYITLSEEQNEDLKNLCLAGLRRMGKDNDKPPSPSLS